MNTTEAIELLASFQLLAELMDPQRESYAVFDQVPRPNQMLGRQEFPDVGTRIWREAEEWIWEYHWVVPGPGPRRRYTSISALVDDMLREYRACRTACEAEQGAGAIRRI